MNDHSTHIDLAENHQAIKRMAASATLHCLIGCAIGEMIGVTIGTHLGWQPHQTVILAATLSFISGYSVSTWPLLRARVPFWQALKTVFAADTVSILTMTIIDNLLMVTIPGAMDKNLAHPVYWLSRGISLVAAFIAAYPVNLYLLRRGKGHALMHQYHHGHEDHAGHMKEVKPRKKVKLIIVGVLLAVFAIGGFLWYQQSQSSNSSYYSTSTAGLADAKDTAVIQLKNGDHYTIVAEPVKRTIDGKSVRLLGYNGMVPGPTIEVEQGSSVTLTVVNNLDVDTTLHPHGINGDNSSDGLPDITQSPIKPGESYQQTIRFPDAGVYWYHPHIREDYTQASGLFANFIVKPKDTSTWPMVSSEQVLTLSDIALDSQGIAPFSIARADHTLMGRSGTMQLVNGRDNYHQTVQQGQVIRYYLTNTASVRPFRFAIPGAKLKLIGADNGLYEQEKFVDTVTLGPAERAIVDVYFPTSGDYHIQNATPGKTYGLGAVTVTANDQTDTAMIDRFNVEQTHPEVSSSMATTLANLATATKKRLTIGLSMDMSLMHGSGGGMMDMESMSGMSGESTTDGIEWEDGMATMNAQSTTQTVQWKLVDQDTGSSDFSWTFEKGTLVNLTIDNSKTTMHPMQHPIHIHGQKFLVTSIDGVSQQNLVWKDTILIPAGKTYTLAVLFDNPGKWMIHCHISEHLEAGMMGNLIVNE